MNDSNQTARRWLLGSHSVTSGEEWMTDFLGYKNKRVVVSGCFSGIGEATSRLLLQLGAEVHGLDYKQSKLDLASFRQIDLREPASIDAAAAAIGGKVDALFSCAGLPQTSPPLDVMKVNYAGNRWTRLESQGAGADGTAADR
jgi:NAD(P)-dependent dehydrogenase (short-subunit alcohol dehydrogenase family)